MATYATKKDVQEVVDKALDSHTLKLFKYLEEEFRKTDQRSDKTDKKIDLYANAIDAYAKQTEKYMQEMLALGRKVDRLEQWIHQIAQETGVKLSAD